LDYLGRSDGQVKVRGFRIELGEIEVALKDHPTVSDAVVLAREESSGGKRLVGYVVPETGSATSVNELRRFLGQRLPEYMIPAVFVELETLPLTPNGKVDRRALPEPGEDRLGPETEYEAPRTPEEEILTGLWAEVLGLERVGVNDNFFELGGDSILSIQIIARANQAGLSLTPRQIFQHPTVAEQAAVAGVGHKIHAEQGAIEGPVPLTPIQRWFLELELEERHHWNHSLLFEVREDLRLEPLREAVGAVLAHHDALRLRLREEEGVWRQENAGVGGAVPVERVDLSDLAESERAAAIERHATELQGSLDLAEGPLVRVVLFDLGEGSADRLLIIIHHLVVDGVSWRILLEDLLGAYQQAAAGGPVGLPAKTTSFRHWAERLSEYAGSEEARAELEYWRELPWDRVGRLPVDEPEGENDEGSADTVTVGLDAEETRALLQEVPAAYRTEINEVLLTALALALKQGTGEPVVLLDLEGHGREHLFDEVDLSRTVGWFTTIYPVVLDVPDGGLPTTLREVKDQLRRMPRNGIGWGLLHNAAEDTAVATLLRRLPQSEILFNYLGQMDQASATGSVITPAREAVGPDRSLNGSRSHLIDINGGISGGRLEVEWSYSENLHERATIERLADAFIGSLRGLIASSDSSEAVDFRPSDFEEFGWSQEDLSEIEAEIFESES
jgi:non-ribosomal peptide synthase protein (TIGR01720 family)